MESKRMEFGLLNIYILVTLHCCTVVLIIVVKCGNLIH